MERAHRPTCGDLLKRYRIAVGLTQEDLAERAHLSARTIGNIERGALHRPRQDSVRLLAAALNLSPQESAGLAVAARVPPVSSVPLLSAKDPRTKVSRPSVRELTSGVSSRVMPSAVPSQTMRLPLAGRARELAVLHRHLSVPAGVAPPVLLIAGEPGIGKTRLLHELIVWASSAGWSILEGTCRQWGEQYPYAPLIEALERHVASQPAAILRNGLEGCSRLVHLLPELAEHAVVASLPSALPPEQERRLLFQAVGRYLANIAGPAGTLLVLDDLQWVRMDTLDLLSMLVRSAAVTSMASAAAPLLRVVGAYRSSEVREEDPVGMLLAELRHVELVDQLVLGSLPDSDARSLLDAMLKEREDGAADVDIPEEWVTKTVQRAGGLPLFLVSCAKSLHKGAPIEGTLDAQCGSLIPQEVVHSVQQRVAALPAAAHVLLDVVAVVGQVTHWTLLVEVARLSGLAEGEVVVALEAACKARLLVEVGEDGYAFANDLTGEALAGALSAARRKALQRQIAAAQGYSQGEAHSRSRSRNSAGAVRRQSGALTDGQYRVGGRTGRTDDGDLRMAWINASHEYADL